jgi:hypothetical protein
VPVPGGWGPASDLTSMVVLGFSFLGEGMGRDGTGRVRGPRPRRMEWPLPAAALRGEERRRDGGRWWPLCFRFPCFCARRLWHATRCQAGEEPTGADCLRLLGAWNLKGSPAGGAWAWAWRGGARAAGPGRWDARAGGRALDGPFPRGRPSRIFLRGVQRRPGRAALAVVVRTCGEITNNNISKSATATNSYGRARPCRRVSLCVEEK